MFCYLQLPETVDTVLRRATRERWNTTAAKVMVDFIQENVRLTVSLIVTTYDNNAERRLQSVGPRNSRSKRVDYVMPVTEKSTFGIYTVSHKNGATFIFTITFAYIRSNFNNSFTVAFVDELRMKVDKNFTTSHYLAKFECSTFYSHYIHTHMRSKE